MQKLILHFSEDSDQKNIYNLIVKMKNVPTDQLEFHRDVLQDKGFNIKAIAHNSIEGKYSGEYLTVVDMIRELEQEGWVWEEAGKVHIYRNRK